MVRRHMVYDFKWKLDCDAVETDAAFYMIGNLKGVINNIYLTISNEPGITLRSK